MTKTLLYITNLLEVKEHSGSGVGSRNHRKRHKVVLQVHDSRLVDQKTGLIRNCEPDDLRRLAETLQGLNKFSGCRGVGVGGVLSPVL